MTTMVPMTRPTELWTGLRDLEDRMNRFFGNLPMEPEWNRGTWLPAVDLHEEDDAYILEADLPGMTRDDIDLQIEDDVVTLKGHREQKHEDKREGYERLERSYGSFTRSFRIPGGVDSSKAEAKFDNGVLRVTLPKPEDAKPRQIKVNID